MSQRKVAIAGIVLLLAGGLAYWYIFLNQHNATPLPLLLMPRTLVVDGTPIACQVAYGPPSGRMMLSQGNGTIKARRLPLRGLIGSPPRTIYEGINPESSRDVHIILPLSHKEALDAAQRMVAEDAYGVKITSRTETLKTFVITTPASFKIQETKLGNGSCQWNDSKTSFTANGINLNQLAFVLESVLQVPIVNETQLTAKYDLDLRFKNSAQDQFMQDLATQTGLAITTAQRDIDVFVVRPAGGS